MRYLPHNNFARLIACLLASLLCCVACAPSADAPAEAAPEAQVEDPLAATAPSGVPLAMTGLWQRSAGTLSPTLLTDYAMVESQKTNVFDDPNVECRGYSIPRSSSSGFGVTRIDVGDDHIMIRYEANAGTRKVFLDSVTPSENSGVNGVSSGSFSRGAVSVISSDFGAEGENAFIGGRIKGAGPVYPMGAEFALYERYRMIDANTLDFVMIMQDPKILQIPRVIHARWTRLPDSTPFLQEKCVLAEDEYFKDEKND
jgi:hypothetical protein